MLIGYLMAGDPTVAETVPRMAALVEGGVDILELGWPDPDPKLDGATIRAAHARARAAGGSLSATLASIAAFRKRDTTTPVLAMGYAAQPIVYGWAEFSADLARAGGDGAIIADLRLRDAERVLLPHFETQRLVLIPLASPARQPSSPVDALPGTGGFLYAIPVDGPTGGAPATAEALVEAVARARLLSRLPVAVGFGVRTPSDAARVAGLADAVIVGSSLVDAGRDGPAALTAAACAFRSAIDRR